MLDLCTGMSTITIQVLKIVPFFPFLRTGVKKIFLDCMGSAMLLPKQTPNDLDKKILWANSNAYFNPSCIPEGHHDCQAAAIMDLPLPGTLPNFTNPCLRSIIARLKMVRLNKLEQAWNQNPFDCSQAKLKLTKNPERYMLLDGRQAGLHIQVITSKLSEASNFWDARLISCRNVTGLKLTLVVKTQKIIK